MPSAGFPPAAAATADAGGGPPDETNNPGRASLARYIAEMATELSRMAKDEEMALLSYFLDLARVEAESEARASGEDGVKRGE